MRTISVERYTESTKEGDIPERPNGADCKSAGECLRWFESICPHHFFNLESFLQEDSASGSSSFGRAIAFQAIGGGFEPRLPLKAKKRAG